MMRAAQFPVVAQRGDLVAEIAGDGLVAGCDAAKAAAALNKRFVIVHAPPRYRKSPQRPARPRNGNVNAMRQNRQGAFLALMHAHQ